MEQSELETVNLIRQISLWQEERAGSCSSSCSKPQAHC